MRYCKTTTFLVAAFLISTTCFAQVETKKSESEVATPDVDPQIKELAQEIAEEHKQKNKSFKKFSTSIKNADVDPSMNKVINQIAESNEGAQGAQRHLAEDILRNKQKEFELNDDDIKSAIKGPDYENFGKNGEYGDDSVMSSAMAKAEHQARSQKETRYGEDVYAYIAVSMSMPDQWFKNMLTSLANEHKDKRVILAFQGAKPGELAKFALAIEQAMPKTNEGSYSVVIDPTIFMRLEIDKVPTFAINTEKGWRKVLGELSLTQAEAYAAQDYEVYEALGRIYDIEEPNMITLLQEKMREGLKDDPVGKMREKAQAFTPAKVELPLAEKSYSYLITPVFTVEQDLKFEGTVFARKGDTVNTLEHLPLVDEYAFVDLSDLNQVEQVRVWKKQNPNLKVFSTTLPASSEMKNFIQEFGYISQVNSLLVERFHIEATPSLAYQVGNQLKIEVAKSVNDTNAPKG
jgi:conjugal transfer pilus assembly protein TraW